MAKNETKTLYIVVFIPMTRLCMTWTGPQRQAMRRSDTERFTNKWYVTFFMAEGKKKCTIVK